MKQSLILLFSTIIIVGCSTTPTESVPTVDQPNTPVPIREAAWSCENSDMTGYKVRSPDYNIEVTCS